MDIQVLISTINQKDYSLLEKMNIQSNAIVINQCDKNEITEFMYKGNKILWMSFNERGVGLSRNNALLRATADICLMADDDMVYVDNYNEIVINAYKNNRNADMILFNVPIYKSNGEIIKKVKKNGKVRFYNSLRYGTVNISFKREMIVKNNIFFSLLFGGGARYGSGEDTLFITDALKKRLNIYSNTSVIATINESSSTWFTGYNKKYFYDRGALFAAISNIGAYLLALQFILRKNKLFKDSISKKDAMISMINGIKDFKKRI